MSVFDIIVAYDDEKGISCEGKIPWKISDDLIRFRKITTKTIDYTRKNMIIMGRKTFESIGKPLPGRCNVVISRTQTQIDGVTIINNLDEALRFGFTDINIERIFVIGGEEIYKEAIQSPYLRDIYVTHIMGNYKCDKKFTMFGPGTFKEFSIEPYRTINDYTFRFMIYRRIEINAINIREEQYRNLIYNITNNGIRKKFRNGFGQYIFGGITLNYDLREGFPLTTFRSLPLRNIFSELIWMLRGSTDVRKLQEMGCHIWDANSSREFLDSSGKKHLDEFDIGPTYGFQWRYFGADYINCKTDYNGKGFDQLTNLITNLRENPESRRHIVSLWNPRDIEKAALPPCMYEFIFDIEDKYLNMNVRIRSSDVAVGLPWNIGSSALLLTMIATITEYIPKTLNITIDNAHIYEANLEKLQQVMKRTPSEYGQLKINRIPDNITNFQFTDFKLENYNPNPGINFQMIT